MEILDCGSTKQKCLGRKTYSAHVSGVFYDAPEISKQSPDVETIMVWKSRDSITLCFQDVVSYVLDHDRYNPDKPVLIDANEPDQQISLQEAQRLVRRLVCGLHHIGMKDGDTVCLHLFNSIIYPILFLGIVGAGGVFTGSNPAYKGSELTHHFQISQSRFVITAQAHLATVVEAAVASGLPEGKIIVFDETGETKTTPDFQTVEQLFRFGETPWLAFDDEKLSKTRIVALMPTSGTTGEPKMAMRSHLSWVTENQAIEDGNKPYPVRRLLSVPFFHAFAAPLALVDALRAGHTTYVMSRFDQQRFLINISRHQITETAVAPTLLVRFLKLASEESACLASVQLIWSGGAPLPIKVQTDACKMLAKNGRISQVYGMTETGWIATFCHAETDSTGSVGRLVGSYEAKIIDPRHVELLKPGQEGELLVRSPMNMRGYLRDPESSGVTFLNGWLRTGDVAYLGDDDEIYIVDRKKDMIKVHGWQVAPAELEACLLEHGHIVDCAVVGIMCPRNASEVPCAYILRKPGSDVSEMDVKAFLLGSLAGYKVRDSLVRFVDVIPRSSLGKVLRHELRKVGE